MSVVQALVCGLALVVSDPLGLAIWANPHFVLYGLDILMTQNERVAGLLSWGSTILLVCAAFLIPTRRAMLIAYIATEALYGLLLLLYTFAFILFNLPLANAILGLAAGAAAYVLGSALPLVWAFAVADDWAPPHLAT